VPSIGVDAEKDASRSTVPIIKLMGLTEKTIKNYGMTPFTGIYPGVRVLLRADRPRRNNLNE
jgi:hypothetical protein